MRKILLFFAALLLISPCLRAMDDSDSGADIAESVIERYGAGHFDEVSALRFTFSVHTGTTTVVRAWTWDRDTRRVTLETREGKKTVKYAYTQGRLREGDRAMNEKVNAWFVADSFWLTFPTHLETDLDLDFSTEDDAALPIGPGRADRLTVQYPSKDGRGPGDAYDLYLDENLLIREWACRRNETSTTAFATTWEDHAQLGPLLVSLTRRNPKEGMEVRFTHVEARLKGSDRWISPKPL